jgi:hypothetical protein
LAFIEGIGYATEVLEHNISQRSNLFQKIDENGFRKYTDLSEVDVVVRARPETSKCSYAMEKRTKNVTT